MKKILCLTLLLALMLPGIALAGTVVVDTQEYSSGILRAEPSFEADIVDFIKNGTDIDMEAIEGNDSWFKVTTTDGLTGFMHKSVAYDVDADTDTITLTKAANLRAEESSDSEYLRGMDAGEELLLISRGEEWSRVIWRGVTGYIHNSVYDAE